MDLESPSLLLLVRRMRVLEGVTQVRYHNVLKPRFKDMVGEDGVSLVCLVPSKVRADQYIKFVTLLTKEAVEDVDNHQSVIDDVNRRIQKYLVDNIRPAAF